MADKRNIIIEVLSDVDSSLSPQKKHELAEWYKKQRNGIEPYTKPPEKLEEPEKREERPSWLARKVPPGIKTEFRKIMGVMFYDPRRHKKT